MLLSREAKVLFIHTSRTGGTTVRDLLRRGLGDVEEPLNEHASAAEAARYLGDEFTSYFRFAFVRNPWARFWSWYGMIENTPGAGGWDFEDFLRSWIQEDGRLELSNQVDFLSDESGSLLVNEVGRFEDFGSEIRRIFKRFDGVPEDSLPHFNSGSEGEYRERYSREGRELVARAYRKDIEAFGYCF